MTYPSSGKGGGGVGAGGTVGIGAGVSVGRAVAVGGTGVKVGALVAVGAEGVTLPHAARKINKTNQVKYLYVFIATSFLAQAREFSVHPAVKSVPTPQRKIVLPSIQIRRNFNGRCQQVQVPNVTGSHCRRCQSAQGA